MRHPNAAWPADAALYRGDGRRDPEKKRADLDFRGQRRIPQLEEKPTDSEQDEACVASSAGEVSNRAGGWKRRNDAISDGDVDLTIQTNGLRNDNLIYDDNYES